MATASPADMNSTSTSPEKSFTDLLDSFDKKLTSLDARVALVEVLHREFRAFRECLESTQEQVASLAAENQTLKENVKQLTEGTTQQLSGENKQMMEPNLDLQARGMRVNLVLSGVSQRADEDTEAPVREFLHHQLKLLSEAVTNITFHRVHRPGVLPADVQQLVLIPEEATEEWRPDVDQQNPEPLHIKEEELCTSLKEEQLSVKEDTDATGSPSTAFPLGDDDDEKKSLLSQLQHQVEDGDPPTSNSAVQMEPASCGETETRRNQDLNTNKNDLDSSETDVSDEDEEEPLLSQLQQHQVEEREHPTSRSAFQIFVSKSEPTEHKIIHGEEKPFSCELCGYKFNTRVKLTKHKRIHKVQKQFACDICEQRFNENASLRRHMRIHTGEKPYACDICEHRFTCKTSLTEHMMIHKGQRPFACDICKRRFRSKTHLRRHMRVHTGEKPFACGICERKFRCKTHLNGHIRIHTGQKPFACDVCQQTFRQKSNLNRHMGIHGGPKSFACDVCQQTFRQKSSVSRHMKIHTKNIAMIFKDS